MRNTYKLFLTLVLCLVAGLQLSAQDALYICDATNSDGRRAIDVLDSSADNPLGSWEFASDNSITRLREFVFNPASDGFGVWNFVVGGVVTGTVTVHNDPPVVPSCQDVTVDLDINGEYTIDLRDFITNYDAVVFGEDDPESIFTLVDLVGNPLGKTVFTCDHVSGSSGTKTFRIRVNDSCGNPQQECEVDLLIRDRNDYVVSCSSDEPTVVLSAGECSVEYNPLTGGLFTFHTACGFDLDLSNPATVSALDVQFYECGTTTNPATTFVVTYGTPRCIRVGYDNPDGDREYFECSVSAVNPDVAPACNNVIQVSLTDDCMASIEPDEILEGSSYGCLLGYDIVLEDENGITLPGMVIERPGTYKVTVIDRDNNNSCWGTIIAEDKLALNLNCPDIDAVCGQDITPGNYVKDQYLVEGRRTDDSNLNDLQVAPGSTGMVQFDIRDFPEFAHLVPASGDVLQVCDINVIMELDTDTPTAVSGIFQSLQDNTGGGPQFKLFSNPGLFGSCTGSDISITLDDESDDPHSVLQSGSSCQPGTPTVRGEFHSEIQPILIDGNTGLPSANSTPTLSFYKGGADLYFRWRIHFNNAATGSTLTIRRVRLEISIGTTAIPFPIDLPFNNFIQDPNNPNMYTTVNTGECGAATLVYADDVDEQSCNSDYESIITRSWVVTDRNGNTSTCSQQIFVERTEIENINWPRNFDDIEWPAITCEQISVTGADSIPLTNQGFPHPDYTGYPENADGVDGGFCDNVNIGFTDLEIPICPGSYKILRKWKVLDWCTGEIFERDQVIKVTPSTPEITCPTQLEEVAITNSYECYGSYTFTPQIDTACGGDISLVAGYYATAANENNCIHPDDSNLALFETLDGVKINTDGSVTFSKLAPGCNWIYLRATNECGLSDECKFEVWVEDKTPPVAVCGQHTVASIGGNGYARIEAESFNDGSWDNCGEIDSMAVRRMTPRCSNAHGDYVEFCCDEMLDVQGNIATHMVVLTVWDEAGNSNTCMVEVQLQDKLPPIIECPEPVTINCTQDTSVTALGLPTYFDNCEDPSLTWTNGGTLTQCGAGTIFRTFTVRDDAGRTASCTQRITVIDPDPFDGDNSTDALVVRGTFDLIWGTDIDIENCTDANTSFHPDSIPTNGFERSRPTFPGDDACSLVAADWDDTTFEFVDGVCKKILREWTVIDWCQYNGGDEGIWYDTQIIKVSDNTAPVILNCNDVTVNGTLDNCEAIVDITMIANDCTPSDQLEWSYVIEKFTSDPDTSNVSGRRSGNRYRDVLETGTHTISWTVSDGCGNTSHCTQEVTVRDGKAPTPLCISSVTTVVMETDGSVEIWAEDFNHKSYDNCSGEDNLDYWFGTVNGPTSKNMRFYCNPDIPNGVENEIELNMWVLDEAGNGDYCTVTIVLQDNDANVCNNTNSRTVNIDGNTTTQYDEEIEGVRVQLESNQPEFPVYKSTSTDGSYAFTSLVAGQSYELTATRDDLPKNGVSTLDLVLIQKHILGQAEFDSPYKIIAADVNNNGSITASDIVELRKIILGVRTEFSNGQKPWRFIPSDTKFANEQNPFPYNGMIALNNLDQNTTKLNFMGMKIGDVNGSVKLNGATDTEVRYDHKLTFTTKAAVSTQNNMVRVPISAENFEDIVGYQFGIHFDSYQLEFYDIESGVMTVSEDNLGTITVGEGSLLMSWNTADAETYDADETLFTLIFRTNGEITGLNSEMLSIRSSELEAEAYTSDYEVLGAELEIRGDVGAVDNGFVLYQNIPNPYSENTSISFNLPQSDRATLTVYDVAGKVHLKLSAQYPAGFNEILVKKSDLGVSGILYYTLETSEHTATKKMIGLK